MTESQRERVDELFGDLIERDPQEWETVLAGVEDAEVRAEVASLLDHTGPTTKGLNTSIGEMMQAATASGEFEDRSIGPGTRFERYRIERRIGQGGMGDVYEAVRENDFHKRVALKIVRYGLDSDFARGRFQQERQMLAGLEHPFIARLLDGGEAANGCPYLVLEYVDGVPIDVYCQTCSHADILQLFLKVCEAVEYAHRNLIIHRDLKPGNILVTAKGEPKLLDFGIAKLLDPGANVTQTMAIALTPQYASPEQIRGQSITTASDVYSLGVILYQLLTGRKPYAVETTTPFEMERVICQEPPASPGIGNELDDILMMALRKEPQRRYASVIEFAQDVERFLDGRAVKAAPDSTTYRVRKYVRRHWIGLASTSVAVVALCVGAGVATYQAYVAKQRLNQVRKLANTFLFDFHDQIVDIAGTTKARAFVVKTAQVYLDDLSKSAGKDPGLRADLAQAYERLADAQAAPNKANLGDVAGAEANQRRSIELYEGLAKQDPKYTVEAVNSWRLLAFLYVFHNRPADASKALDRALALAAPLRQDQSPRALEEMGTLYDTLDRAAEQRFDYDGQVRYSRQALEYVEAAAKQAAPATEATTDATLGRAHLQLGRAYFAQTDMQLADGEYQKTRQYYRRALDLTPQSSRLHILYINSLINLSNLDGSETEPSLEKPVQGGPYAREAIALIEPMLAADPNDVSSQINYVATLVSDAQSQVGSDPTAALRQTRHAAALWADLSHNAKLAQNNRYLGLDDERTIVSLFARLGASEDARKVADALLEDRRKLLSGFPPSDDNYWFLSDDLRAAAEAARSAGDRVESDRLLQEAVRVSEPFAAAADKQTTTAFFASRLYRAMAQASARRGACTEARAWQAKDKAVWIPLAQKYPYAAVKLQQSADDKMCRQ